MAIAQKKLLGERLVEKGVITEEQLEQAQLEARADAKTQLKRACYCFAKMDRRR